MHNTHRVSIALGLFILFFAPLAHADHAWGSFHWARTSNPFTLKIGDNVSAAWDPFLITTAQDWSASSVLDLSIVLGTANPKNCRPTLGRGEVCNAKYGSNGWLGIAQIWISGDHITQGVVKVNDSYFTRPQYNTPAWRNLVMCQEVGHLLGLDHQDENMSNANLNTCMDYTNDPTSNQHPNQHDYDMLATIYAHLDAGTTLSQTVAKVPQAADGPSEWGKEIRRSRDGRASLFVRDDGNGEHVFTHVFWADERADRTDRAASRADLSR